MTGTPDGGKSTAVNMIEGIAKTFQTKLRSAMLDQYDTCKRNDILRDGKSQRDCIASNSKRMKRNIWNI